jgi:hypothetical protein
VSFYVASDHLVLSYALPYFARLFAPNSVFDELILVGKLMKFYTRFWKNLEYLTNFERRIIEVAPTVPEVHPVTHVAALRYFGHNSLL